MTKYFLLINVKTAEPIGSKYFRRTSQERFLLEYVDCLQNPPMITTKQENKNCCFVVSTANS